MLSKVSFIRIPAPTQQSMEGGVLQFHSENYSGQECTDIQGELFFFITPWQSDLQLFIFKGRFHLSITLIMLIVKPVGGPRPRHEFLGFHFLNKPLDQAHVLPVYMAQRREALHVDTTGEREMRRRWCHCVQVDHTGLQDPESKPPGTHPSHTSPGTLVFESKIKVLV